MSSPIRCHLLIGPPGSGKTTLAHKLAPLLQGPNGEPGLVLSTDVIRAELFGDAAIQGPWPEIRDRLLQRLHEGIAAGIPVIIDATHARRPWRLIYTQAMTYSRPVEWIGWWLTTPEPTCLAWARNREREVPEAVIREFAASLAHKHFGPDRSEGFAALVTVNPAAETVDGALLQRHLDGLDKRIRNAVNLDRGRKLPYLHRYSRLLDLERLLFLIRLMTTFNGLDISDPGTASALLQVLNPAPEGDLAERAAAYLASWSEIHGGNCECYADVDAIRSDLAWLAANGFSNLNWSDNQPLDLGPGGPVQGSSIHGGYPALGDGRIFRRVFTLLRHILQEPFDAPAPTASGSKGSRSGTEKDKLYRHLIEVLGDIEGGYAPGQEASLRKDLELLLTPYGFRPKPSSGRPDNLRHGYALGTALLSADQLLEVYTMLKASVERLGDPSQQPVLDQLRERLLWAGVLHEGSVSRRFSKRALANRSFTEEKPGTLADPELVQRLERAIKDRRRVRLRHLPDPEPSEAEKLRGEDGSFRAWPLQLLFHNISWYLAFETYTPGRSQGLIRCLRLDRLVMLGEDGNVRRSSEDEHSTAMERLQRLLHVCGGLYFGNGVDDQLAVMPQARARARADGQAEVAADPYAVLRFSCTAAVFRLIREEPRRFPPEHTAHARPRPGDDLGPASPRDTLEPNPPGDSHPYPVEIRLPRWTVEQDWDLRNWLFRWGGGIRIELPLELRQQQLQQALEVVALYESC
ncbi:AAA family ATPase [Vulcanococcus limneticus]|uniref:AAA family ATPase n=1 Tax=Vulcanococcus limneticus TaxID=2170428 RepID=UPI000B9890F0|nr:AAA family ATPase [Vulcanococcus limneticus]MCP9793548.1 AAA family ATPase [Vulcanococcus limneticus MW73D5]MCP9898399.1 AAA family ATPase [Vulcanococcus limneticus Candia 3B3]